MVKVVIRTSAKRNLKSIMRYIARDNPKRAYSFTLELETVCYSLAELPLQGRLIPKLGTNIRRLVHGNYSVYYRLDENKHTVFILRITEQHQDQSRILFED